MDESSGTEPTGETSPSVQSFQPPIVKTAMAATPQPTPEPTPEPTQQLDTQMPAVRADAPEALSEPTQEELQAAIESSIRRTAEFKATPTSGVRWYGTNAPVETQQQNQSQVSSAVGAASPMQTSPQFAQGALPQAAPSFSPMSGSMNSTAAPIQNPSAVNTAAAFQSEFAAGATPSAPSVGFTMPAIIVPKKMIAIAIVGLLAIVCLSAMSAVSAANQKASDVKKELAAEKQNSSGLADQLTASQAESQTKDAKISDQQGQLGTKTDCITAYQTWMNDAADQNINALKADGKKIRDIEGCEPK